MQCRGTSWLEGWKCHVTRIKPGSNAGIRVQQPVGSVVTADCHDDKRLKEKRMVRAHSHFAVFDRLAFMAPSKNRDKQMPFIVRVSISCIILKL